MSAATFFHGALNKCKWNLKDIEELLSKDSSFVNKKIFDDGYTPLHFVLRNKNCSLDIVKLLLKYGADVNLKDPLKMTPLYVALKESREDAVVITLIAKGAHVKYFGTLPNQSSLCIALHFGASKDVIEILLEMENLVRACRMHNDSILHCATEGLRSGLKLDVLQMLIDRGADINARNRWGENVMCCALQSGNEAGEIELLLEAGISLNSCHKHSSALICATYGTKGVPLRESTVSMLLKSGACVYEVNDLGRTPLQNALLYCRYEVKAISLLLDQFKGVDMKNYFLLHLAVKNSYCLRSMVKLLIEKNIAKIDKVNKGRRTALHEAVRNVWCQTHVTVALLKNNAKVDYMTVVSALRVGHHDPEIFKVLLTAGASISKSSFQSLVIRALNKYKKHPHRMEYFQLFLRYYFLKDSYYRIPSSNCSSEDKKHLMHFKNLCIKELINMKSKYIGQGYTLHEFLSGSHSPYENSANRKTEKKKYDIDLLLDAIANDAFPLYFDIVSYKIGRPSLKTMLQEVPIYTVRYSPDNAYVEKMSVFCYDCVLGVARYLTVEELLSLIVACFNGVPCARANEKRKRSLELPKLRCKLPRLCKK